MPKKLDLTNTETDYFKIISPAPNKNNRTYWNCICKRCNKECVIPTDSLRGDRTKSCGCLRKDLTIKRNHNNFADKTNKRYGKLICLYRKGSIRDHAAWVCQCDCGNKIITDSGSLEAGYVLSCGCKRSSLGELKIQSILKENNIPFKQEYIFSDLKSSKNVYLRFDFAILDENNQVTRLIEYDGEQHYLLKADLIFSDTLEQRQQKDKLKNEYCLQHNIPLVRIPYWEKKNIDFNMLFNDQTYEIKGEDKNE